MRILVVTQYFYPEQFRINDICRNLHHRGHQITVLTGQPNYPDGVLYPGYENRDNEENYQGIRIIRCQIHPRHKGAVHLLLNYLSFINNANKRIHTNEFDVIFMYQLSPITSAIPAIKLKKKWKLPLLLYCCDIWPESVRDTGGKPMSTLNPVYLVAKMVSKRIYKKTDRIGVKCKQFTEYLHDVCGIEKENCFLLYEHAEDSYLTIPEKPLENGCFDFMFLGNIGLAQNCDYIVRAAERLKTENDFRIHFVGNGSGLEYLKEYVKESPIREKVIFHGQHPVSEINGFYEIADCCLLTLSARTATGLTPPSKLVSYMASARPVIAAATGATKDIVTEADCGICVEPEDIDGLSQAMQFAMDNQDSFRTKGKNGRRFFKLNFTLEKYTDLLEKELNKMVSQ